ncbi:hypothetical protein CGCS363_v007256 [Colletotrichum siamense]|uniref:uncharacterized protein n=1 Tax=Colletotrichum siamense TaxID=690259 RepID=UPI001873304A|nr:uncharacterized protein CGCS363_v007256 [Colletotrichum siamense]KAF5500293.1 hypothetical protein CGCS363_v007256 [Colletotrichum siamense]
MPKTERSWVKDNDSAYLIDAGMWTACKESALVLVNKRHKSQSTRFGSFRDGVHDWVFDIDIRRDLLCFQLSNDADWNSGWGELPFWRTSWWPPSGICSIAVEYDSSWAVGVKLGMAADALDGMQYEPGPRGFFLSILAGRRDDSAPSIYLIDRSIRRRRKAPHNPGSFNEKYRSKGRTFGVVKGLRDVAEKTLTSGMNALNFLEAIGSVEGYWTWEKTNFAGISRSYYLDPEEAIPVLAITDEEDVGSLGNE